MNYKNFVISFHQHIHSLSNEQQFNLALSVCKKLFPGYQEFYLANSWGDPDSLLDAISFCQASFHNPVDETRVKEHLQKVFDDCPHSDDFENAFYAINASGAVDATLRFLIDNNPEHIYEAGIYLTDTIDSKIQEDRELSEQEIDDHPSMIEARQFLLGKHDI